MNDEQLQAVNNYYVSHLNWLIHRGRDDQIDAVADEYERDVSALHPGTTRLDTMRPDQAA